jgi:hypothetical protein
MIGRTFRAAALAALTGAALSHVAAAPLEKFPRSADGHPDLSGVWQALGTAHWNVEPHVSDYPAIVELGAQFAIPPGQGVIVGGGKIPYKPEAVAQRDENFANRVKEDPETKCYMGGVPRSTYMPYPFQIFQNVKEVVMVYQFATGTRRIFVDGKDPAPLDSWMGWSNARWEGESFVVEVTGLNGLTWLDRAGNYASSSAKVTERYTPLGPNHLQYEATIEDPDVYSRPWTIKLPLYRIVDDGYRMLEFKCEPFAEEKLYGHLTRQRPGSAPKGRE